MIKYDLKEADSLKEAMYKVQRESEEAKEKYYNYLREMMKSCKHEWEGYGMDYKCTKCGKLDY